MNRDDVIRMAREADEGHAGMECEKFGGGIVSVSTLERFAALVAAAEREGCAKSCEDRRGTVSMFGTSKECAAYNVAVYDCAAEIRARGTQ